MQILIEILLVEQMIKILGKDARLIVKLPFPIKTVTYLRSDILRTHVLHVYTYPSVFTKKILFCIKLILKIITNMRNYSDLINDP